MMFSRLSFIAFLLLAVITLRFTVELGGAAADLWLRHQIVAARGLKDSQVRVGTADEKGNFWVLIPGLRPASAHCGCGAACPGEVSCDCDSQTGAMGPRCASMIPMPQQQPFMFLITNPLGQGWVAMLQAAGETPPRHASSTQGKPRDRIPHLQGIERTGPPPPPPKRA